MAVQSLRRMMWFGALLHNRSEGLEGCVAEVLASWSAAEPRYRVLRLALLLVKP